QQESYRENNFLKDKKQFVNYKNKEMRRDTRRSYIYSEDKDFKKYEEQEEKLNRS
ncbi:5902_t:CDS:1, partial [Scutellospora calospora]